MTGANKFEIHSLRRFSRPLNSICSVYSDFGFSEASNWFGLITTQHRVCTRIGNFLTEYLLKQHVSVLLRICRHCIWGGLNIVSVCECVLCVSEVDFGLQSIYGKFVVLIHRQHLCGGSLRMWIVRTKASAAAWRRRTLCANTRDTR